MVSRLEDRVVALPMVESVVRRTGRAERDEHAQDVQFSELEVTVRAGTDSAEAARALREASSVPGLVVSVGQPIGHRIEHMLSGVKTSSPRTTYPFTSTPNSNLVSAKMIPFVAARSRARAYTAFDKSATSFARFSPIIFTALS